MPTAGPEGDTEGGDLDAKESRVLDVLVSSVQASALPIWILGGAVTASGRVLADIHWYDIPTKNLMKANAVSALDLLTTDAGTCRFATVLWTDAESYCAGCQTQWRAHALAFLWCQLPQMFAGRCVHEITIWDSQLYALIRHLNKYMLLPLLQTLM